jgi:hypothetical protein
LEDGGSAQNVIYSVEKGRGRVVERAAHQVDFILAQSQEIGAGAQKLHGPRFGYEILDRVLPERASQGVDA